MDKSFKEWRLLQNSDTEDESDIIEDSKSDDIIASDSDDSLEINKLHRIPKERGRVIESSSDESDSNEMFHKKNENTLDLVNGELSAVSDSRLQSPSFIDDSSCDNPSTRNSSKSFNNSNSTNTSTNEKSPIIDLTEKKLTSLPKQCFIDLTLPTENTFKTALPKKCFVDLTENTFEKSKDKNFIEEGNSDDDGNDANKVLIFDSDSGEDKDCKNKINTEKVDNAHITNKIKSMEISKQISKFKEPSARNPNEKSENDYHSRLESLKAEEMKLKMQASEVLKNIETTKSTLRTANISALPDRGVRLQMYLKKQETILRDLRYQQNTLANEILSLQFTSNCAVQGPPKVQQKLGPPKDLPPTNQKMFKLPTTTTDINALGKKAMETHRTQQALTIDALRTLHNSLKNCPSEESTVSDPKGILVSLMPHQKHALAWLLWREQEKPSGGILADDMGLGKTLTLISLILKSAEQVENQSSGSDDDSEDSKDSDWFSTKQNKRVQGKTLVVCPASLIGQWQGEIDKRVSRGMLDVVVHHGANRETRARKLAKYDVVITTYNIVSRDASKTESPLFQIRWRRIILDEAHQIRNSKTQTAAGVFQLRGKSRWALTGTPVHNKELDLYALIRFLRCSPFDDLAVWKRWVDNRDAAGMQRLNTITKSIMLRRTKKGLQEAGELKSLTEKKYNTIFIKLDEEESTVYEKLLNFSKTLFAQFLYQKADKENLLHGMPIKPAKASNYLHTAEDPFKDHPELARLHKQMKEMTDVKSHHILVLLLRLRQFCCHPALIKTMLEKEEVSEVGIEDADGLDIDLMNQLSTLSLNNKPATSKAEVGDGITALAKSSSLFSETRLSSKLKKVIEVLDEIFKSDDKVLIVSQWVSLLNTMKDILKERKVKFTMLTGQIPVKDRPAIVDNFNRKGHGPRVMLLSLTAGGVGLNLVGGNHLLLLDLHWNPQLESQASDRIYRVGQLKNVQIYKFVASETIEERILNLQQNKLAVAEDVLTGSKHATKLSLDDLKMLFDLKK